MINLSMMSSGAGRVAAEKVVEIAAECGFGAVEWVTSHGSNGKRLRQLVRDAGLQIAAYTMYDETFLNRGAEYLDRFKENLEIAVEAEAPLMMIPPFARSGNMGPESDRREWIGYFSEIFPLASKAGIPLALESTGLSDSPVISADDILEVLHAIPGMKVVFDNGNTSTADDPLAAFERLLPWIIHIHFKDSQISDVSKAGFTVRRNGKYMRQASIGTGSQDLHAIFRMLKETGYDKWITLESSDPDRSIPIKDVLKENIRLIELWEKEYADE